MKNLFTQKAARGAQPGFTLIELLVVIAIPATLREAASPFIGIPAGPSDVELAVDVYFPNTIASVNPALNGRSAHPGGRNRLFLDGHTEFLKDARTPRN